MDYNTRLVANNPVWDKYTVTTETDVAAAATPQRLDIPAWARYVIVQPVGVRCKVIPRQQDQVLAPVKADPGIEVASGGSLEIAIGTGASMYLEVTNNNDKVWCTFFA